MAHPFGKLFYKALSQSTSDDNRIIKEAKQILEKGYPRNEICAVLLKLEKSLIDDTEASIVREAREEVCEEDEEDD